MKMTSKPLQIGAIVYPDMDQLDFTGPFEILSRLDGSVFHVLWKEKTSFRDKAGLILTAEKTFAESPQLDILVVPGGPGQEALMDDEVVLSFLRTQARAARCVFSVCTGALLCGAAGLLRGVKTTTHWSAHHLLPYFGAVPVDARVVVDGQFVSAAGVTSGLNGALRVAALLCGDATAQAIQLAIEYAPEPPFQCGTIRQAPPEIAEAARFSAAALAAARLATARRFASRLQGEKR